MSAGTQVVLDEKAGSNAAKAKFAQICIAHPGSSSPDMKARIVAALDEFGIVRRSTATRFLQVKESCDDRLVITYGFKHLCFELMAAGLPAVLCYRPYSRLNSDQYELCLVKE